MANSWLKVQKEYSLSHIKFDKYFKNIGRPFFDILEIVGVKNNYENILQTYQKESVTQSKQVKFYKNTIKTLEYLKKKKFTLNIVTSKDLDRTKFFLGNKIKYFTNIQCLDKKIPGKPNPLQINKIVKNSNSKKEDCVYIGDTHIDYLTAKNSKIDFIYAKWGYGLDYNYKYKCSNIEDILNILDLKND